MYKLIYHPLVRQKNVLYWNVTCSRDMGKGPACIREVLAPSLASITEAASEAEASSWALSTCERLPDVQILANAH